MNGRRSAGIAETSIGVVGAGEIARKMHLPVLKSVPGIRVAWLSDHDSRRADALGTAYGVPAVGARSPGDLPPCEVALLAVPVEARLPYLREFAARGTAVLCEKPFALSEDSHREVASLFVPSRLACGYMRRFYRSVQLARDVLTNGWLGPLRHLSIREGGRSRGAGVSQSFLDDPKLGSSRGVLADLGSHTLDLALFLTGATQFEVTSRDVVRDEAVDRKVSATILLGPAESKVEFDYCVSWLDRQPNEVRLTFDRCSLWFGLSPAGPLYLGTAGHTRALELSVSAAAGALTYGQAFYLQWQAFLAGLRENTESPVSAQSCLGTTILMERLLQAT